MMVSIIQQNVGTFCGKAQAYEMEILEPQTKTNPNFQYVNTVSVYVKCYSCECGD